MNQTIRIKKADVVPYIYFVCSMAQRGKMYAGLSGKSDYIGGIFDRWINIIPESVIFNKYFLPKLGDNLSVISDYYAYDPKKTGIAPDVLGVKVGKEAKAFAEYDEKWQACAGAPQIEVKAFKEAQYMVSLRNQGYDDKYLVMVETKLDSDYLLPFFESAVLSRRVYRRLMMNDRVFIKSNQQGLLSPMTMVKRKNTDLGELRLITVCLAKDFMRYANLCSAGESPFYIATISESRLKKTTSVEPLSNYLSKNSRGLYSWNKNWLDGNKKHILLDCAIENLRTLGFVKSSKSSITVSVKERASINHVTLEAGKNYILKFQLLDRASSGNEEYFMSKSIIDCIPSLENKMLDHIKRYIAK